MRRGGVAALGLAVLAAGCTGQRGPALERPPVPVHPAGDLALASFSTCGDLLRTLRGAAERAVGPYGFGDSGLVPPVWASDRAAGPGVADTAGAAAPDHSGTNVQEPGVDEPDVVTTDGRRIVLLAGGVLRVVDAATRQVTGTLDLTDGGALAAPTQLLLAGDRVLALTAGGSDLSGGPIPIDGPVGPGSTSAALIDLAGAPRLLGRLDYAAGYVDARMVGTVARVVVTSRPRLEFPALPDVTGTQQRTAANKGVIERAGVDAWLPTYTLQAGGATSTGRVGCDAVRTPARFSGASVLTVLTIDLAAPLGNGDPLSVAADGDTVYGTATSLYVAGDNAWARYLPGGRWSVTPASTRIYQFDTARPGRPEYVAAGQVPGRLLNRYALSEYAGQLRVASTTDPAAGGPAGRVAGQTQVQVLTRSGATLAVTGRVGGLGRGQQVYAVRFAGPVGYVVTFRTMDPLYVLDLADPARPRVTGDLEITGYSAYLHPLDGGRLLGVGQEASARGARLGVQVSLFDVSDPAAPSRTARYQLDGGWSQAEQDPHAFLYWPATGTLVVPVAGRGPGGALVLRVGDGRLTAVGTVRPPDTGDWQGVARSLVVGGTLWTVSPGGLLASDLATLARQAWLPFG